MHPAIEGGSAGRGLHYLYSITQGINVAKLLWPLLIKYLNRPTVHQGQREVSSIVGMTLV